MEDATGTEVSDVGSGQVSGGWGYVWAAYGITWFGLILLLGFIFFRGKK